MMNGHDLDRSCARDRNDVNSVHRNKKTEVHSCVSKLSAQIQPGSLESFAAPPRDMERSGSVSAGSSLKSSKAKFAGSA